MFYKKKDKKKIMQCVVQEYRSKLYKAHDTMTFIIAEELKIKNVNPT